MENQKIGIGPTGPVAGLIQFIVFAVAGIVIFVYAIPYKSHRLKDNPGNAHDARCARLSGASRGQFSSRAAGWRMVEPWQVQDRIGNRDDSNLGRFHLCSLAVHAIYLSRMAYWAALPLVRRNSVLAHPAIWHQLEWLAFQGTTSSLGHDGSGIHRYHGPLHPRLESPDQSRRDPVRWNAYKSQGAFQRQLADRILGLVHCLVLRVQSCFHNPGMAICQVGTSGRSNRSDRACPYSGLYFLAGKSGLGHQPDLFFCCGGLLDHFLVVDLFVAPSVLGGNQIHQFWQSNSGICRCVRLGRGLGNYNKTGSCPRRRDAGGGKATG